jgi:hypothetical protein
MRKFLKYINNNFEIVTYHKNEENTIIQENIAQESINKENSIIQEDINTKNKSLKNKSAKNKSVKNKSVKKNTKSKISKQEDFDLNISISKFNEGEKYINEQRIEIFNNLFNTNFSSTKISRIIKDLFTSSSTRINGKKTIMFQNLSRPNVKYTITTQDIVPNIIGDITTQDINNIIT